MLHIANDTRSLALLADIETMSIAGIIAQMTEKIPYIFI
jgi:hypothetical protein